MGSLIEELRRREAAARAGADRVRCRIQELAEELARAEEQVSRLVIAREEVTRLLEGPAVADPPAGQQAGGFAGEPRQASPAGAVTVPPWQDGAEASALPRAYQGPAGSGGRRGAPAAGGGVRGRSGAGHGQVEGGGPAVEAEAAGCAGLAGRGARRPVRAAGSLRENRETRTVTVLLPRFEGATPSGPQERRTLHGSVLRSPS
jgi:hypothetical protein